MKTKLSTLRNKADKLLQETIRRNYSRCEVCGKPMSCGHHFFPKSMSAVLRYNLSNIIPICAGCHLRHHCGDPAIHARIIEIRGQEWYDKLKEQKERTIKVNVDYYKNVIDLFKYEKTI
jgi:5-methylcytosine-specific restriction endonuclease McrA